MTELIIPGKRQRPNIGSSVRDGKIRYTSITQIRMFDRTLDGGCPRKWAYAYKFRIKLERTDALKKGSDDAALFEHYLTSGEDVLPRHMQPLKKIAPAPGPDLECEQPLGDIERAVSLRDDALKMSSPSLLQDAIESAAGLTYNGVPVEGAPDVRHRRGWYIDTDEVLKQDPPGTSVVHIDDLKMVTRIFPQKVMSGPNAGMILPSYCKTDAEVVEDEQLLTYAKHAIRKYPDMTHARLGLLYVNKNKREAAKRTGIISVEQILERTRRFDDVVREMEQVATVDRIEDVEPNTKACDEYTHVDPNDPTKTLKGCGYRYQCPLHIEQVVSHMLGTYKESSMSLCDQVPGAPVSSVTSPTPPSTPPLDAATHAAAVEAEKEKLRAQLTALTASAAVATPAPPVPMHAPTPPQVSLETFAQEMTAAVTEVMAGRLKLDAGTQQVYSKKGVDTGWILRQGTAAELAALQAAGFPAHTPAPVVPPSLPIAVAPPDQPKVPDMLAAAAPVPAAEIARITDPELKEKVEAHAREFAAKAAAQAAATEAEKVAAGTSVWCTGGSQKLAVSSAMAVEGYTCACTRRWTIKALEPQKEGDQFFVTIPRHKPKNKAETPTETQAAPFVAPTPTAPVAVPTSPPAVVATVAPTLPAPPPVPQVMQQPTAPTPPPSVVTLPFVVEHTNGHTNGNGMHYETKAEVSPITISWKTRQGRTTFRAALASGRFVTLIATSMKIAMEGAEEHATAINDEVKGIEKFEGTVLDF